MVNAHPLSPTPDPDDASTPSRFHVLLTEDRSRPEEHWTHQLPRLIKPLGIHAHRVATAEEALEVAGRTRFHAAFVDLATPRGRASHVADDGGLWLLRVLQRLETRPPVVVVNSRATQRQAVRLLNEALRLGAFSVVNQPVQVNALLTVIQRLLDRHHRGQWPSPPPQH